MKPCGQADKALIEHMLECVARIREYTRDGRNVFLRSGLIQDAVIRNLQTLAESSQRLSDAAKDGESSVPWKDMAGMRMPLLVRLWRFQRFLLRMQQHSAIPAMCWNQTRKMPKKHWFRRKRGLALSWRNSLMRYGTGCEGLPQV